MSGVLRDTQAQYRTAFGQSPQVTATIYSRKPGFDPNDRFRSLGTQQPMVFSKKKKYGVGGELGSLGRFRGRVGTHGSIPYFNAGLEVGGQSRNPRQILYTELLCIIIIQDRMRSDNAVSASWVLMLRSSTFLCPSPLNVFTKWSI